MTGVLKWLVLRRVLADRIVIELLLWDAKMRGEVLGDFAETAKQTELMDFRADGAVNIRGFGK
jgi:hypothetical protein